MPRLTVHTFIDQWSPELALSWRANDQLEFFGRGYRGYNAGGAAGSVTLGGRPFYIVYKPERSDNLEVGADLDWADGRLTARLTAFYTTLSKQWTPVLGGADFPLGQVDNSGRSRLFGLECDARLQIDKSHQLQMSLGYLNTSYVDFVPFERDADLENVAGNDFAGAPEFSGALAVARHMTGREIDVEVDVGVGRGRATVWTCDLTHGYIDINADYRS